MRYELPDTTFEARSTPRPGPATLAEEGWPLDCVNGECVPLPREAVEPLL